MKRSTKLNIQVNAILTEFGLRGSEFYIRDIPGLVFRFVSYALILGGIYLVFRPILINHLLKTDLLFGQIGKLYEDNWFEILFWVLVALLAFNFVLRIIYPVRFSFKIHRILILGFVLFVLEKYYWVEFSFFPSKLILLDYAWILLAFPFSEAILRIFYILKTDFDLRNESLFIENQPVIIPDTEVVRKSVVTNLANEIRKSHFKSSYSIGVVGDWGTGKTSLIKTLDDSLKATEIVVHFSPWLSFGKKSLLQGFSDALTEKLGKYDGELVSELDHYIKSLIKLEKSNNSNLVETIEDVLSFRPRSKRSEFESINDSIKRIGKRVIVFIDDLDRLDSVEIVEVLKLIRNTANFSNVIYIVCYDKVYLLHAIQQFNKRNLSIILDKFFDIEIPISPIAVDGLITKIDEFFVKHAEFVSDSEASEIKDFLRIHVIFSQYREVNRFLSSLELNYQLYGSRLYIIDFFFFELLKVRFPFLPAIIWQRRSDFFSEEYSPSRFFLKMMPPDHERIDEMTAMDWHLSIGEASEFDRYFLRPTDLVLISILMDKLFREDNFNPLAIRQPNAFDTYFYYEIPESKDKSYDFYKSVTKGSYSTDKFFNESYNAKKESEILSFVEDGQSVNRLMLGNQDALAKFLIYLVEWSDGRFSSQLFVKLYKIFDADSDKSKHFKDIFQTSTNSDNRVLARMNFLSILIRILIYEPERSDIEFITKQEVEELNFSLFNRYLVIASGFSNRSFDALQSQVSSIDLITKKVTINSEALLIFRKFIDRHKTEFLDLNIRSGMVPNYDLSFIFHPLTFKLFEGVDEFKEFVRHGSTYPERRKLKFLEYLSSSKVNKFEVHEFQLDELQLRSLPIEFINAWRDIQKDLKDKIRFVETKVRRVFANEAEPSKHPDRNDIFYKEFFDLKFHSLRIEVQPGDTEFWRLGFVFLKNKELPPLDEGRMASGERPDIHIEIGERNAKNEWILPNQIEIKDFYIQPSQSNFVRFSEYKKQEKLTISLIVQDSKQETFALELHHNDRLLGSRTYNLSRFKYFVVNGWAEKSAFKISADFTLVQPIL